MAAPPFKVKALFEYASPEDDDLNFPNGQIITVTEEEDDDWYNGEYVDEQGTKRQGIFPKNFVERFEPETPPRPARSNRPKKAAEPELPGSAVAVRSEAPAAPVLHGTEVEDEDAGDHGTSAPPQAPSQGAEKAETAIPSPRPPVIKEQAREQPALAPQPSPKPEQHTQAKAPPPVAEKPATGSFRDRIAAFNKPTAPPVAPFKPGGLGSGGSGFIKKPFVAPPPSKNAYVPPPREAPQKIYRREEDPDLVERTSEDAGPIERPIVPVAAAEGDEDQPKPTSLKERIALLQKQQQEQAVRHAEVAQKKEKAKRPPKKRVDSSEPAGDFEEGAQTPELERVDTAETVGKRSLDIGQNGVDVSAKQKSSADPYQPASANAGPQDIPSDANDADQSGGGETTEDADETSTGIDETEEKPRSKAPAPPIRARSHRAPEAAVAAGDEQTRAETVPTQGDDNAEEEEAEEEEDEDIDPEARRRLEIRERMAKMSGGMGMHGMFGPPGGMPPPAAHAGAKRAKASGSRERSAREHTDESNEAPVSPSHAPPVPVMPMPGRPPVKGREETAKQAVAEKAKELPAAAAISARDPEEVPDVEEVAKDEMVPPSSVPRSAPPPAPRGQSHPCASPE
ncbi:MAG: hypothetical protein M1832_004545 [Thelocarpon impressellum]|nr:MAG: hypothetical protein M1832_004545 [Thelocarpon impressellum]